MSATSRKLNRLCKTFIAAVALPALVATLGTTTGRADASDGISGAIFTTTSDGTPVNKNIYEDCADVYLNGGPQNVNDAGLKPFGIYYFQVTVPGWKPADGATGLLSTDNAECRQVLVGDDGSGHGVITGVVAAAGCEHALGALNPANGNTPVQLFPFSSTPNPGGEYKAWLIRADLATVNATDPRVLIFSESDSKTDNFKCGDHLVPCAVVESVEKFVCISCSGNLNVPCTSLNAIEVVVNYDPPTVTGAADPTVVCSPESGTAFPAGVTTTVTCTVTDQFGDDTCSFDVAVGRCPSCTLSCPLPITTCNTPGLCGTNVDWPKPSCDDAPGVTVVCTNQLGTVVNPKDFYPVGITTVTCTASDPAVPGSPCSFTITVNDCEAPTFTCPAGGDLGCNPKTLPTCASLKALILASDNCPGTPVVNCNSSDSTVDCLVTRIFTITATDGVNTSAPCYVTNTWTVDIDAPAITCPAAKNVQCETFTPVTTATSITVDAFKTLGGTISDNCSGSLTLTYKDTGPVGDCPKVYTRTFTAVDGCKNANTCTQSINCFCASLVTDTARCTLLQPCDSGPGFRMIFTQDPLNLSCYKLTASNPGQFYYNAFHVGLPGQAVTFQVTLPYPFVTQGANPIEVYDSASANYSTASGQTCFTPGTKILPLTNQVTLATYGPNPVVGVTTTSFTITVPAAVNDTGFVWLAVHLDYGLKGQSFGQNTTTLAATQCSGTTVLIPNNQTYSFALVNGSTGSSTIKSCNVFKKLPGIGGLVCNSVTTRMISGVSVALKDSTGKVLATSMTDQDGWYMCTYKWAGKAVTLSVGITPAGYKTQTKSVTLKSNGYAEVDFTCP